jgi:hypothetical protein
LPADYLLLGGLTCTVLYSPKTPLFHETDKISSFSGVIIFPQMMPNWPYFGPKIAGYTFDLQVTCPHSQQGCGVIKNIKGV